MVREEEKLLNYYFNLPQMLLFADSARMSVVKSSPSEKSPLSKKKKTKVSHIKTPTLTEEVCITHFCVDLEMFQTTCLYVNVSGDCCSFKAPRGQPILTGLHGRYGSEPNLVQVLTSNTAS